MFSWLVGADNYIIHALKKTGKPESFPVMVLREYGRGCQKCESPECKCTPLNAVGKKILRKYAPEALN